MRWSAAPAFVPLCIALAACSGGAAHVTPSPKSTSASAPAAHVTASLSLTIPAKITRAASARRAQYVSPSVQSGVVVINGVTTYVNLEGGSPSCPTLTNSGGRLCLISVPATIGTNTVSMTLYDGAYNGTSPSGNALSAASNFTFNVAEGQSNVPVPLVLGGVPASFSIASAQGTFGSPTDVTYVLTTKDADGNTIVAPGSFSDPSGNPLTITLNASPSIALSTNGGQTTAQSVAITDPTQLLTAVTTWPIVGFQVQIVSSSGAVTLPAYQYVQNVYAPTDYEQMSSSPYNDIRTLQSVAHGVISAIGENGPYAYVLALNGGAPSGCMTTGTPNDAVAPSSAAQYYTNTSTLSSCSATYSSSTYADTVSYTPALGPIAILPNTPSANTCSAYAYPSATTGTAIGSITFCTDAHDLTTDSSWLSTAPYAAYGAEGSFDSLGFIASTGTNDTEIIGVANAGALGGVAVRDNKIFTYDDDTGRFFEYIITGPGAYTPAGPFSLPSQAAGSCIQSGVSQQRTFTIAEDGYAYLAMQGGSCPEPGLLQWSVGIAGSLGTAIQIIAPNLPVVSASGDLAGRVYFTDTSGNLYVYPSTAAH